MGLGSLVATSAYQPEPQAAAAARHFVRETLQSWQRSGHCRGQDCLVDDAVLLTSELVTNAVVHAGTSVQVTCRLADEVVEIAVVDQRPVQLIPDMPHGMPFSAESMSGRGLQLPSELASSWGVTYARTFKAVWFRMSLGTAENELAASYGPPGFLSAASKANGEPSPRAGRQLAKVGYEELLRSIVQTARAASGADAAYLMVVGDDGEMIVGDGGEMEVRAASGVRLPQPNVSAMARAAAGLMPQPVAGPVPESEVVNGQAWCFPLITAGREIGLLVIGGPGTGLLPAELAELAEGLARRIAVALDNRGLADSPGTQGWPGAILACPPVT